MNIEFVPVLHLLSKSSYNSTILTSFHFPMLYLLFLHFVFAYSLVVIPTLSVKSVRRASKNNVG